jgi:hypothetical protein
VVLYHKGKLTIYAAKWEWAIASKMQRMSWANPALFAPGARRGVAEEVAQTKRKNDLSDLFALLKHVTNLREGKKPSRTEIQDWVIGGAFIKESILDLVETEYYETYGYSPFA